MSFISFTMPCVALEYANALGRYRQPLHSAYWKAVGKRKMGVLFFSLQAICFAKE